MYCYNLVKTWCSVCRKVFNWVTLPLLTTEHATGEKGTCHFWWEKQTQLPNTNTNTNTYTNINTNTKKNTDTNTNTNRLSLLTTEHATGEEGTRHFKWRKQTQLQNTNTKRNTDTIQIHCHSWQRNTPQERREHAIGDEEKKYICK